jgi:hypothetical protein
MATFSKSLYFQGKSLKNWFFDVFFGPPLFFDHNSFNTQPNDLSYDSKCSDGYSEDIWFTQLFFEQVIWVSKSTKTVFQISIPEFFDHHGRWVADMFVSYLKFLELYPYPNYCEKINEKKCGVFELRPIRYRPDSWFFCVSC